MAQVNPKIVLLNRTIPVIARPFQFPHFAIHDGAHVRRFLRVFRRQHHHGRIARLTHPSDVFVGSAFISRTKHPSGSLCRNSG